MIVLVRHGETEGNARRILQVPETPLSAAGIAQAEAVAERLATLEVSVILSSDFLRAHSTAEAIATRTGARIETAPLLRERSFGDLRGKSYAELSGDPLAPDFAPPNGETWDMFHARVAQGFALIAERAAAAKSHVVVVSHGLFCSAILRRHAQLEPGLTPPVRFDNTSVSLLEQQPPYRATLINCTAHLRSAGSAKAGPV